MRNPFIAALVAALAVGFAAEIAGLAFPIAAVLAILAALAADALTRRRMQP